MTNDPRKSNDSDNQPFGNPQQSGSSGFEWPGSTSASQPQQPQQPQQAQQPQQSQQQGPQQPPQQPVAPQQRPQETQQIPRTPTSQSVSDVPSSLGNPNNPYSAAGPMAQPPQAQQVKEKRTIGLLPAAALIVVAAIASGPITGIYATLRGGIPEGTRQPWQAPGGSRYRAGSRRGRAARRGEYSPAHRR